jgi:predicted nucleic acid-binding protein
MKYLLDTNVFIESSRKYPINGSNSGLWDWLLVNYNSVMINSLIKVCAEIKKYDDDISLWVSNIHKNLFLPIDRVTRKKINLAFTDKLFKIWYNNAAKSKYSEACIVKFTQSVDFYIIFYAYVHNIILVTLEKSSPSTVKIKIPDICNFIGAQCIDPNQMFINENVNYRL